MAQREKKETAVTPVSPAAFCHIHEPDKKIWSQRKKAFITTEDESLWRFKTSQLLDKGVAVNEAFIADLVRRHTEAGGDGFPSCVKDGDAKPKKKKGEDQKPAPFPGQFELRLKSQYPPALIDTAGEELPVKVKVKAGDTIASVIAYDTSDTDIYVGLVTYLQSIVLVRKSKGHLEAARKAIAGADFGDDAYVAGDAAPVENEENEDNGRKDRKSRRNY